MPGTVLIILQQFYKSIFFSIIFHPWENLNSECLNNLSQTTSLVSGRLTSQRSLCDPSDSKDETLKVFPKPEFLRFPDANPNSFFYRWKN